MITQFRVGVSLNLHPDEKNLEVALRLELERVEPQLSPLMLAKRHRSELFEYDGTPLAAARDVVRAFRLSPDDVVFDLGSGYGIVCLTGALMSRARFIGVELVAERHCAAERIRTRLGLENASFLNANALDVDLVAGTKFYLFSPFFGDALAQIDAKLRRTAQRHPISVMTALTAAVHLAGVDYLTEVRLDRRETPTIEGIPLRLFRSV